MKNYKGQTGPDGIGPCPVGSKGLEGPKWLNGKTEGPCVSCGKPIDVSKGVNINIKLKEVRHIACADLESLKVKKLKELADAVKKI